jgi:CheY-like chemotaxis protein
MRLNELTPAHVRRAIDVYLRQAYPPSSSVSPPLIEEQWVAPATIEELLTKLPRDRACEVEGGHRYSLQLGNHRYPFMKFVLEEYLVAEEYFFAVDTHDNLAISPGAPDYREWLALKDYNRDLGASIEASWRTAGIPTLDDLRALCESLAPAEREADKGVRVLLVDDNLTVAFGLRSLLRARGYECRIAHTGEMAMAELAADPLPEVVILDYELPGMDGRAVLSALRAAPRTAKLAILMATASAIEPAQLPQADAILRKPYAREPLFRMVGEMARLQRSRG